ncbi:hypothetical protein C8R43DRAFT_869878 [Mycena crocata]|nr:hypothetical protein C8R43DRAFT_881826 [Mycena crocata]KAJ7181804.1 hypothetical protein C8R43DRAFT_869878 [Mycena crocata]
MPAILAELEPEAQLSSMNIDYTYAVESRGDEDVMDTVRVTYEDIACTATQRAFLASLIPASKFTQDKCYSNRAWAKLSGSSAPLAVVVLEQEF